MQQRDSTLDLRFWWPFDTCDFLIKSGKISKFKVVFPGDAVDCIWGGYVEGVSVWFFSCYCDSCVSAQIGKVFLVDSSLHLYVVSAIAQTGLHLLCS